MIAVYLHEKKGTRLGGVEDIIMGYFIFMFYCFVSCGRLMRTNSIPTPVLWFRTAVMMMLAMGSVELIHIKLNREYQLAHWGLYFVNSNMIL